MSTEIEFANFSRALSHHRMSPTAHYILWRCGQSPLPRLTDIVEETGIKFPSVSFTVNRMIKDRLLVRGDGYGAPLQRTPGGDHAYQALMKDSRKKPTTTKK